MLRRRVSVILHQVHDRGYARASPRRSARELRRSADRAGECRVGSGLSPPPELTRFTTAVPWTQASSVSGNPVLMSAGMYNPPSIDPCDTNSALLCQALRLLRQTDASADPM